MEEVLFKTESMQSRAEIAESLRTVADRLDDGGEVTFSAGNQSQTLSVPARAEFEIQVEREQSKAVRQNSVSNSNSSGTKAPTRRTRRSTSRNVEKEASHAKIAWGLPP